MGAGGASVADNFGRGGVLDGLLLTARDDFPSEEDDTAGWHPGVSGGGALAAGQFISPTGRELAELQFAFKEGSISREEKEAAKLSILAASTDD